MYVLLLITDALASFVAPVLWPLALRILLDCREESGQMQFVSFKWEGLMQVADKSVLVQIVSIFGEY